MDLSYFLAKILGLYLVFISLAFLKRPQDVQDIASRFSQDKGLTLIAAFLSILVGLSIVLTHNVWEPSWQVIPTIFGWISLAKGLWILYFPTSYTRISNLHKNQNLYRPALFFGLILGLTLTYFGFIK